MAQYKTDKEAINVQLNIELYNKMLKAGREMGLIKPSGVVSVSETVRALLRKGLDTLKVDFT